MRPIRFLIHFRKFVRNATDPPSDQPLHIEKQ
jgi:hypothetical protein